MHRFQKVVPRGPSRQWTYYAILGESPRGLGGLEQVPMYFVDSSHPLTGAPPPLKTRRHMRRDAARKLWHKPKSGGVCRSSRSARGEHTSRDVLAQVIEGTEASAAGFALGLGRVSHQHYGLGDDPSAIWPRRAKTSGLQSEQAPCESTAPGTEML